MQDQLKSFTERNAMNILFDSTHSFDNYLKASHINLMTQIALWMTKEDESINHDLLLTCCLHHDDGASIQYSRYGEFDDNKTSHHALGLDLLDQYLLSSNIPVTHDIQILRACIYYHGRLQLAGDTLDEEIKKYVQIVSDADEIEQECLAPVGYIQRKIANAKTTYRFNSYKEDKKIRPKLFEAYQNGQSFYELGDFYGCNTSAEQVLEGAAKTLKCIKKYGAIAKWAMRNVSCYGYSCALAGYTGIFFTSMSRQDAERAVRIMTDALK